MAKYRKKPVIVEAIQFNGKNRSKIEKFMGQNLLFSVDSEKDNLEVISIKTLEGVMEAKQNDWIIKGIKGEFYPCAPDIFAMTYDLVESED